MIKKALSFFLKKKKMAMFRKNALVGDNLQVDIHSICRNNTGTPDAIKIGSGCLLRGKLLAQGTAKIKIGNNCYMGGNAVLNAVNSIEVGNEVIIARDTYIYDHNSHPVEPELRQEMSLSNDYFGPLWSCTRAANAPVVIEDNVWIGERCTILKGVRIGRGSVVGAGSVVTKNIPAYCIAAGNPAKVVKQLEPKKREQESE